MASGTSRVGSNACSGWAAHAAGESSGQDVVSASQVRASRAGCPVCSRSIPLTKTGAIRIHGPLSNRCAGSGMSLCSQGSLSSVRSPEDSETPPVAQYSSSELLFSSELRQSTRVLKRIPRAARHLAATKLASVLDDVSEKNDSSSWARLFKFGRRCDCLAQPRRGGQRRSLTTVVKRQLEVEADPSFQRDSCLTQGRIQGGGYGGSSPPFPKVGGSTVCARAASRNYNWTIIIL